MTYKEAVKQAKAALEDIETRGTSAIGSSWDDVKKELFTPEEIAESEAKAARLARRISRRGASKYKLCHTTIEDLFKNYNGKYTHKEIDWGEPVGNEVW